MQDHALWFLVVGVDQAGQYGAVDAGRGLDDIRHETLPRRFIEVRQVLAAELLMLGEVEVAAIVNALQFTPAKWILYSRSNAARVVCQLLRAVLMKPQVLGSDAQAEIPVEACFPPMLEPLHGGVGFDEELHLHLLELTGAKDEIARGDFIAESLADLGDPEGDFLARWLQHITKIDVDALRGFRPQVDACPSSSTGPM